jgi:type I restriction enzyme M protein
MSNFISLKLSPKPATEADVEVFAAAQMKAAGYDITMRACRDETLKKHWPSKSKAKKNAGFPDMLLHIEGMSKPVCVWENKSPKEGASVALSEAKFYIEGLRQALPAEPALPFMAAGYDGTELLISVYTNEGAWVPLRSDGVEVRNEFPLAEYAGIGISSHGEFTAVRGAATANDLRALLPKLKTLYRNIPTLNSGRAPIDFTVALLTLKMIVERKPDWGTWSEQPRFSFGSTTADHAIGERLETLVQRVKGDHELNEKYGDIFEFSEKTDTLEIAFSFSKILGSIEKGRGHFSRMFELTDALPPLTGADFDIFGEVYQAIGDEATKKKLGEFFTGRHIISGILPVLFSRAGIDKSFAAIENLKIADIACGTGGFLTEILRLAKATHSLDPATVKDFSRKAFFGYDIGHANASRARVNMYFAGDGFSSITGGLDALSVAALSKYPKGGFDIVATNPPYGKSSYGRLEEAFLLRSLSILKKGTGWLLIVLPTGVLENPRSSRMRFNLLNEAKITDVISLPKHAFAPYTQQRTAVIVAQRRAKPLVSATGEWSDLIAAAEDERVSMFIVDNDGYANSDKRYPTDMTAATGEWLHNDLASWRDKDGAQKGSKLVRALVHGKVPDASLSETGTPLADKYGVFDIPSLSHPQQGLSLLPDVPLRADVKSVKLSTWLARVNAVVEYTRGNDVLLPLPFAEEVAFLLDHSVEVPGKQLGAKTTVKNETVSITKGNQGLTEAAMYRHFDPAGLPVYGGGSGRPRFHANASLTRATGEAATKFHAPAIVVSMDGSSGSMQIVEKGEFFCNHHGAVLKLKAGVDPWSFVQTAEPLLKRQASNKSGSATLTKPALESLNLRLPTGSAAEQIAKGRQLLKRMALLTKA